MANAASNSANCSYWTKIEIANLNEIECKTQLCFQVITWVNVVRCLLLAGVGHDAVVGVCPACWGNEETPLPGEDTPPETDESPLFGSGFSFLNAPSAISIENRVLGQCCLPLYTRLLFSFIIWCHFKMYRSHNNFANKFLKFCYRWPLTKGERPFTGNKFDLHYR